MSVNSGVVSQKTMWKKNTSNKETEYKKFRFGNSLKSLNTEKKAWKRETKTKQKIGENLALIKMSWMLNVQNQVGL